jgi:NADPH oxidase
LHQFRDYRALGARLCSIPPSARSSSTSFEKLDTTDVPNSPSSLDITSRAFILGRSLPDIRIDGPFGSPSQDVLSNEVAVLVGAGIGITPFASIMKDIKYKQGKNKLGALRRVLLVWINREVENFEWFNRLLKDLEEVSSTSLNRKAHRRVSQVTMLHTSALVSSRTNVILDF